MKFQKIVKWILLVGFVLLNIIAYNHAYKFTHFTATNGNKKIKPENLSFGQKLKLIFTGVDNPKPVNNKLPRQSFEIIEIKSDVLLNGWLIEVDSSKGVVVLFHGYSGNKSGVVAYAEEFNKMGFSTSLMDFRGSGDSEGNETTIGFKEAKDVEATFNFIKNRFPNNDLILFGTSMGAVSIMKAVVDLDVQPNQIILECPFGTMRKTVQQRFKAMNLPSFPFADMLMFYGGMQTGFNPYTHKPTEYAKNIDIPTLLLYGKQDARVTLEETETIYKNLSGQKELVILKNSGHENYLNHDKKDWLSSIDKFIKKNS
ncbi:MAG: alpha/beta hydrolase [Saprospiraceae bacterium]